MAVGGGCFWHSLIGVDENNGMLTPIITWADSRCREDAAQLRQEMSEREVHERTAAMLRISFWPAKLLWLRRTQPALFARDRLWMSPAEWLWREFAGERLRADSRWRAARGCSLRTPWTGIKRCCPAVRWRRKIAAAQRRAAACVENRLGDFPELRGVPWFPALGDGAASNLGCGATKSGAGRDHGGTSAAGACGKGPRARPWSFCYRVDSSAK